MKLPKVSDVMQKLLYLFLVFFLFGNTINLSAQKETSTLKVKLTNFKKNGHMVRVGLCNTPDDWLKTGIDGKTALVKNGDATVVFENLPKGNYAVSCYYDENGNEELDTGFLGIPNEPYAFSNNPSTMFGPPKWEKSMITIKEGTQEIN